jgi:predicted HicB family RNase H-like nuclease
MKKRKGSLTSAAEKAAAKPAEARKRTRSLGGDIVGLTLRVSKDAWRELHDMAFTENISINMLAFEAFNHYRQAKGLPPLKPLPPSTKS